MTLNAGRVGTGRQSCLLCLKATVWIVTIAALHHPFQHLVMKWLVKVGLNFIVTTDAELRFSDLQQVNGREVGLLCVRLVDKGNRFRDVPVCRGRVRRVTQCAADVVAPVFTTPEVVAFFSTSMTGQTSFRYLLGILVLERNDLGWITFFKVRLARTMTGFATGYFLLPTGNCCELGVGCMRERLELILMTIF